MAFCFLSILPLQSFGSLRSPQDDNSAHFVHLRMTIRPTSFILMTILPTQMGRICSGWWRGPKESEATQLDMPNIQLSKSKVVRTTACTGQGLYSS